jgi:hypothetical protein
MEKRRPPSEMVEGVVVRPKDEVVWISCRAKTSCEGRRARVLLKRNEGIHGTWIQYVCLTCGTPFSIRV